MALLPKKSSQNKETRVVDIPVQGKSFKFGKNNNSEPEPLAVEIIEAGDDINVDFDNDLVLREENDPVAHPRIRLSADILKETYVQLKCFSIITNETIVSILTRLIDTHCSVKVSL